MSRNSKRRKRLSVEALEDRRVLATFTVNLFGPSGDSDPVVNSCPMPPPTMLTLRHAVRLANECGGADEVRFAPGMNNIPLMHGRITISDELIIRGSLTPNRNQFHGGGTPDVTVDGQGNSQIFYINDSTGTEVDVTIEALTLTGGDPSMAPFFGGAIYSRENLTLKDMVIDANTATRGGAIYDPLAAGSLTVIDSTISNNSSIQSGGGVFAVGGTVSVTGSTVSGNTSSFAGNNASYGGGLLVNGNVTIENSTISGNLAGGNGGRGGGIKVSSSGAYGTSTSYLRILNSDITGNAAVVGGGLRIRGSDNGNDSRTVISNSTFSGNAASYGGALYNYGVFGGPPTEMVLSQVTVSGNTSASNGSAIFNKRNARLTVDSSVIESNTTTSGNASIIMSYGASSAIPELIIKNSALVNNSGSAVLAFDSFAAISTSTISGNSSTAGVSSGVRVFSNPAYNGGPYDTTAVITSTTIANNYSNSAQGAINADGDSDVTVESSIVSDNAGIGLVSDITGGIMAVVNHSLLELGAPGSYTGSYNLTLMSAMLGPLTTNMGAGRATMYHPLLSSSPVIDQGSPSIAYGFDQRRYLRVGDGDGMMGAVTDMGSFEYGSVPPAACDLNGDGYCNITDLNQVSYDVATQALTLYSDLNNDGALTSDDVVEWLTIAGAQPEHAATTGGNAFIQGDADLDGMVDEDDFAIWNANKFTDSDEYGEGDFNGDGVINGRDFLIWNANKFTSSMLLGANSEEESVAFRSAKVAEAVWVMFGEDSQRSRHSEPRFLSATRWSSWPYLWRTGHF